MDTLRLSADPGRFPDRVREELTDVDRLRRIWAEHRQAWPREERETARRDLIRARIREAGVDGALADLLVSATVDGMAGRALTREYAAELAELVHSLPDPGPFRAPRNPLTLEYAHLVADPAAVPGHPLVRAAVIYIETLAIVTELDEGREAPRLLPWVTAALVLRRSDFPPLPPTHPPAHTGLSPEERLAETVSAMARAVMTALRDELGWTPPGAPPPPRGPVPPLAAVTRRRILDYLRSRREPVGLILRALDPGARVLVRSGGFDDTEEGDRPSETGRAVLTPGAAHWWSTLELAVGEAVLTLTVVTQEIGRPRTGVLAVIVDGRLTTAEGARDVPGVSIADSVTVMPTDCVDDRWPQIRDLVDEAVSQAMGALTRV
ncbi:hypothetical protein PWG71_06475 [Nocardiopsis sp. N85]|uniref:hypothetical protein n=1 Tax=Nocardiopsis sp. N85 TaxID=3029400 RepID=UPI00237F94B4|nr:hypothetical protein [Nocardiopsis sp. N85]MDE3721028.1 hypothetical protein [Nocardiopsis sp. N85]